MKKKKLVISLALATPILLIAVSGSRANPSIEHEVAWDSAETKDLFYRACADCHSNETKWPWYSYVAPMSWRVIHNVHEGREEFNISAASMGEADEAAEKLREGEMPPSKYLLLHPNAKLTLEEKNLLLIGLEKTFGSEHEDDEHEDEEDEHHDEDDD